MLIPASRYQALQLRSEVLRHQHPAELLRVHSVVGKTAATPLRNSTQLCREAQSQSRLVEGPRTAAQASLRKQESPSGRTRRVSSHLETLLGFGDKIQNAIVEVF